MVKIIKRGNEKFKKVIRFNCPMCETVFDADKNDYSYMYAGHIAEIVFYCECPVCGNLVYEDNIHSSKESR